MYSDTIEHNNESYMLKYNDGMTDVTVYKDLCGTAWVRSAHFMLNADMTQEEVIEYVKTQIDIVIN